ncbi:hypothetical protein [Microbulbifer halophilus]|uniref:Uncharacterized protein n=1 Tax=Microbulbifer halophilus TaxID=453963 RepID=A0ABW5E687_9GAMM|nr:hypothetical protein [Microbulbifer halophilus]MCW8127478.1 hypothetical protein [Microbulbifer halophilus]
MSLDFFRGEWRRLLVDTLVVLIGVLAALVLNNVREDIMAKQAARGATARLVQEVADNAEALRDTREVTQRRLLALRELREELPADKSLRELVDRFHGYWVVELNASSWEYLSRSALADSVDPDLLQQAFALYKVNRRFDQLNGQIQNFVYSETFVSPDAAATALNISEAIMTQQLRWSRELLPQYEEFLDHYAEEGPGGQKKVALK